ncbi:hypothetical protein M3223_04195 [Paenibacillus pasadenensis]|nr:hypothetical protein [Paenibacillus pasadenensis]
MSKERVFNIGKNDALSWADWKDIAEYPEDMERLVPEFVHEIISFHAVDSYETIIVEQSEVDRVKEFILKEVVA